MTWSVNILSFWASDSHSRTLDLEQSLGLPQKLLLPACERRTCACHRIAAIQPILLWYRLSELVANIKTPLSCYVPMKYRSISSPTPEQRCCEKQDGNVPKSRDSTNGVGCLRFTTP
eukprot:6470948-Amphidinium_carterae.1